MRFMSMHKATPGMEADEPPTPELMAGMGVLLGELEQAGVFIAGEGLRSSSHGVRVRFSGGKRTVTKGPFAGPNELMDRYLIVRVQTLDEAIEWAARFADVAADCEIDVRPVNEPWDIGMMPKPADDPTTRYMIIHKADRASESSAAPTAETRDAMRRVTDGAPSALLMAEALQPSSRSLRLRFSGGKRSVIDGPFTESKELIACFSILELPSMDEAVRWATRFDGMFGEDLEIDIRPMYEPEELR